MWGAPPAQFTFVELFVSLLHTGCLPQEPEVEGPKLDIGVHITVKSAFMSTSAKCTRGTPHSAAAQDNGSIGLLNVSGSSPKGYHRLSGGEGGRGGKIEKSLHTMYEKSLHCGPWKLWGSRPLRYEDAMEAWISPCSSRLTFLEK